MIQKCTNKLLYPLTSFLVDECILFLDVALYTDPEEIYLVRKDGTVMMYDPTNLKETLKIKNSRMVSGTI